MAILKSATTAPHQTRIDGRTRSAFLDHDVRTHPPGGTIHLDPRHANASGMARVLLSSKPDHNPSGLPTHAHAAVIHGTAAEYVERVDGGREKQHKLPPDGMQMVPLKSADYPDLMFSPLYNDPVRVTDIAYGATHTVQATQEGDFKVWNITLQRGADNDKFLIKFFIDQNGSLKVGKGSGDGFKGRHLISEDSGNLFLFGDSEKTSSLAIYNGFKNWDDDLDEGKYFPPMIAEIDGETLKFKLIAKSEFDRLAALDEISFDPSSEPAAAPPIVPSPTRTSSFTQPEFVADAGVMRSAMEMAGIDPALIEATFTNAYLITTLIGMGFTSPDDQKMIIDTFDLKAKPNDILALKDGLAGSAGGAENIDLLFEAKTLGDAKLFNVLLKLKNFGFKKPEERKDVVDIFALAQDPNKVDAALATLIDFYRPLNFSALKNAKALNNIGLYPVLVQMSLDSIDDLAVARNLINDFSLTADDLKAEGQPNYTSALKIYQAFGDKAYNLAVVEDAKTWALDDSISVPDVIGILTNFLDGKNNADKDLIYGAFMVAYGSEDKTSLTAILNFGKIYSGTSVEQRESARDLLTGYTEGDYASESGKARFARLLLKQMPQPA
jgi:hypothetical protein